MNHRLAAIDIGTNSIRCIIVEAMENGDFRVLDDEKAAVRLGEGLAASGQISPAAWERAQQALLRMRKIIDGLGVEAVEAVATSAVRQATNGRDFLAAMLRDAGLAIRLISGEEEAALAALSARHNFPLDNTRTLLVDIGGGSVEIVSMVGENVDEIVSLPLGAVVLTERFLNEDPLREASLKALRSHVRKTLRKQLSQEILPVQALIGSGGTMTNIAGMAMAMRKEQFESVHHYEVLRSEVVHLLAMLERKDQKSRRAVPGLNPERADIIVAGVLVVDELMRQFRGNLLRINEKGLREGLILQALEQRGLRPGRPERRDWRQSVEHFAQSCHFDEEHSRQVNRLAQQIFAGLASRFNFEARSAQLLEAAALLHDVGYFISYAQHHKHSFHLIRHADLFGFSPREREIVANLARYHRKSLPKKKHEGFARLSAEDRLLVQRLGGILRLADGLDRRRARLVDTVRCRVEGKTIRLTLDGAEDLSVELYGGRAKGDLFAAAFGCRLELARADTATAGDQPAPSRKAG
jgi:exopolyphosphatase/guanosine-5'-triphosphate,3'-diphosphate pyrophosphatase